MQRNRALMLKETADAIAHTFSNNHREHNYLNERFEVSEIIPTSESTAIVKMMKSSGKQAIAFCYWINMSNGQWRYFFPTYDHCIGMEMLKDELKKIEQVNFPLNFKEDEIYS